MMNLRNGLGLALAGCVLVLVAASYSMAQRHRVESRHKAATIAVEYDVVRDASVASGITVEEGLAVLKKKGLGAIVLPEATVGDGLQDGSLKIDQDWISGLNAGSIAGGLARRGLRFELPPVRSTATPSIRIPGASIEMIRGISLGLPQAESQLITKAGLKLIARHNNVPGASMTYFEELIKESKARGASVYLPQGDQVLGHKGKIDDVMAVLKANGMVYASPEFAKMSGETNMLLADPENVLRLHSIQAAEADKMTPSAVVERFGRAYSERNQTLLMIRPFDISDSKPIDTLGESVAKISSAIAKEKGANRWPTPTESPTIPRLIFLTIGLGILCAGFGLGQLLQIPSKVLLIGGGLISLFVLYALYKQSYGTVALIGAMVFPILGFTMVLKGITKGLVLSFLALFLVSWLGGFCVAGLLNSAAYFVKAETFEGVKFAHFLPILICGALVVRERGDLSAILKSPLTYGAVLIGFGVMAMLGFMMARTGNDNPAAVSGFELQLRSLLEQFFVTRPRTKEFMIGYPAILVGLGMLGLAKDLNQKTVAGMILAVGTIATTSTVNTMCHLHTPVMTGIIRTLVGCGVGIVIGGIAWSLIKPIVSKKWA